jgi:hypothetical protein
VPVATLSGLGNGGSGTVAGLDLGLICSLLGTTTPFSAARLAALYPTHAAFVARWTAAVNADVAAGFIRPADATQLIAAASQSSIS